jgi:surface polysaccharide O-acyltransferase-like enzyme
MKKIKFIYGDLIILIVLTLLFSLYNNSNIYYYTHLSPVVQTAFLKLYLISMGVIYAHAFRKLFFPNFNIKLAGDILVLIVYTLAIGSMAVGG